MRYQSQDRVWTMCHVIAELSCTPRTLRTRDPRAPSASAVLVPLHMLLRYDYLAGSLGGGVPLVPVRSACTRHRIPVIPVPVRIRGRSPGRTADSSLCLFATARTRAVTMVLPVRIRRWSPSRTTDSWASLSPSPDSSLPFSSFRPVLQALGFPSLRLSWPLHGEAKSIGNAARPNSAGNGYRERSLLDFLQKQPLDVLHPIRFPVLSLALLGSLDRDRP